MQNEEKIKAVECTLEGDGEPVLKVSRRYLINFR